MPLNGIGHRAWEIVVASGLLFLLFFPAITGQGASSYLAAIGQTRETFLTRWLLLTALGFGLSAITYALGVGRARRRERGTTG